MKCDNPVTFTGILCIIFGALFFFMYYINTPDIKYSNPFELEAINDKYRYFNANYSTTECTRIKNDILLNNKTLYDIFPMHLKPTVSIIKAIYWITIIKCFYILFVLVCHVHNKPMFYFEFLVGASLLFLYAVLITIKFTLFEKYNNFLGCSNVNSNEFRKYNEIGKVYNYILISIFYLFYIALLLAFIFVRRHYLVNKHFYN